MERAAAARLMRRPARAPRRRGAAPKRVFLTSSIQDGYVGLAIRDEECEARGALAGPGWKAWISTSSSSAAERITDKSGPYTLVDGTPVASSWAELIDGSLEHAID